MPRAWRNSLLLAILPIAFSCLLWGQAQIGSIVGSVLVVRGDFPNHPILVELQLHHATINSTYCDGQGRFGFYGLGSDVYHVIVRDDAYNPVDEVANLDLMSSSQVMLQIRLTPRESAEQTRPANQGDPSNPFLVPLSEYNRHFDKHAVKEFSKGVQADRDGKREDAMRHYEAALHIAPDFYPAHNNLGSDYLAESDFSAAQAEFETAIKLNEDDPQAHLNLGNVFLQTKRYDIALSNVQEGLRRQPNSAFGKFLLGSIYARTGQRQEAERALHDALELDPQMARVHLELVNLYLSEQKKEQARTELQSFLKQFPNDPLSPKAKEVLDRLESSK